MFSCKLQLYVDDFDKSSMTKKMCNVFKTANFFQLSNIKNLDTVVNFLNNTVQGSFYCVMNYCQIRHHLTKKISRINKFVLKNMDKFERMTDFYGTNKYIGYYYSSNVECVIKNGGTFEERACSPYKIKIFYYPQTGKIKIIGHNFNENQRVLKLFLNNITNSFD